MKLRFTFSSGIPPREEETPLATVEEALFYFYGTRMAFENLGGKVEVLEEAAPAQVEETVVESKPVAKRKKIQKGESGEADA